MKTLLRPAIATVALSLAALTGCSAATTADTSGPAEAGTAAQEEEVARPSLTLNVKPAKVAVSTFVKATAADGELKDVAVTYTYEGEKKTLRGKLSSATTWKASQRLEPGTRYFVKASAEDEAGKTVKLSKSFVSKALALDEQTYASVAPLDKSTVGVGQPVAVRFDVPVTAKANFEKAMTVTSTPKQKGSWHWLSDYEARYRPASYWKPGTEVKVDVKVNSLAAGNGIYGQYDKSANFKVAKNSKVVKVNLATQELTAFENGKVVNTIPISSGKPGFTTRSGTKVIMEKHRFYDMNSTSIGIDPNSSEGYDLSDVEYAMRLTNSGEFFHAAPWNEPYLGVSGMSHGCTGLGTADAAWLYNFVDVGTPIEYTGSNEQMTLDNGFGDWSIPFKKYKTGSAL